jgi:DNA-binding GntR family transcriptional regulator
LEVPPIRDSVRTRIKQTLLERILDGTYEPGTRLKELLIAREFHTSQAPVREALRELEAVGLIETKYYQGSRVKISSKRELEEAYEVRASLEELAGNSAASVFKGQTKRLRKMVDKITALSKKGQWQTYTRQNFIFHRTIIEASGNVLLLKIWESLHFEFRTRIFFAERTGTHIDRLAREHYAIVDALDSGNGRLAGRLLREHSLRNVRFLRRWREAERAEALSLDRSESRAGAFSSALR